MSRVVFMDPILPIHHIWGSKPSLCPPGTAAAPVSTGRGTEEESEISAGRGGAACGAARAVLGG